MGPVMLGWDVVGWRMSGLVALYARQGGGVGGEGRMAVE